MKPLNSSEINKCRLRFIAYFSLLVLVGLLSLYSFFFAYRRVSTALLAEKEKIKALKELRLSIRNDFDLIADRIKKMSDFRNGVFVEVREPQLVLADIQKINKQVLVKINAIGEDHRPSFELYKQLYENVEMRVKIADSLFKIYVEMHREKTMLDDCELANKEMVSRLKGGRLNARK